jgi:hypothetical protein
MMLNRVKEIYKNTAIGCEFFSKGDMWSFDVDGEVKAEEPAGLEQGVSGSREIVVS